MTDVFISYELGTQPEKYDVQFELPAELDLIAALDGDASAEATDVFNEDFTTEEMT